MSIGLILTRATAAACVVCAIVTACSACHRVEEVPPAQPVVDGERISFPKDGRQTMLIKSASADAYFATTALVPGRLAWNEDKTSRIFSPVAGRVVAIWATPGKVVKAGMPLAGISSP